MNNPLGMMFQIMMGVGNPQQIIGQMMNNSQIMKNPIAKNAMNMYQNGDTHGLKTMAENICKERGMTTDEAKQRIMGMFGSNQN